MKRIFIYIHGRGGTAAEAEHYIHLLENCSVLGFEYESDTPWDAQKEFSDYFDNVSANCESVYLIANSIGAYFSLCSLSDKKIEKAFFISPVVNMEKLICDMMTNAGISESDLREKKEIPTSFGETLSWDYLQWVRSNKPEWKIPTEILYGENDNLQSLETVREFSANNSVDITVMKNGEHWFHTEEQMRFMDEWMRGKL